MTREEIIKALENKGVPINAVFSNGAGGKYLSWGGKEILDATIGKGVIEWHEEGFKMPDYDEWAKLLNLVKDNPHIYLFHYTPSFKKIQVYGDSEFMNMLDLVGGFGNYIKAMEE